MSATDPIADKETVMLSGRNTLANTRDTRFPCKQGGRAVAGISR